MGCWTIWSSVSLNAAAAVKTVANYNHAKRFYYLPAHGKKVEITGTICVDAFCMSN